MVINVLAAWVNAEESLRMGLVWRVCEPDDLLAEARKHADVLASRPIPSLIAVKQTMVEPTRAEITAEILASARRQMAAEGAAAISLRAVTWSC